ncbi:MAG: DUF167 domain-containing protein [Planctomycetes bacterium]|nr:DUF167 domain-containing protein [Planctomycetota bacterium]
MIDLVEHAEGIVLAVRAHAAARRSGVEGIHDGMLKVSVTQAAEKGKANKALIAVLSRQLGLRKTQIELLAGHTSPQKRFLIRDIDAAELRGRIDAYVSHE